MVPCYAIYICFWNIMTFHVYKISHFILCIYDRDKLMFTGQVEVSKKDSQSVKLTRQSIQSGGVVIETNSATKTPLTYR